MTNTAVISQATRDVLVEAVRTGDANTTAQIGLEAGRTNTNDIWAMAAWLNAPNDVRTGFWSDVETLLRLETASDEQPEGRNVNSPSFGWPKAPS